MDNDIRTEIIRDGIIHVVEIIILFAALVGMCIQNDKLQKEVHQWKIKYYESVTGQELDGLK